MSLAAGAGDPRQASYDAALRAALAVEFDRLAVEICVLERAWSAYQQRHPVDVVAQLVLGENET